jgi:hypothetical protein
MGGLLVQFLGLFALLGLAAWGYRHWISPRQVGIQGKGMLLLSVVTLVGGLLGSTGWWIDDPRSFSWDLPPLASRMLASAGWALSGCSGRRLLPEHPDKGDNGRDGANHCRHARPGCAQRR